MSGQQAEAVAKALGGEEWQSGGGTWLVLLRRQDGRLVVLGDESACEYKSQEAFDNAHAEMILLH
jgi:hypothetical protein